MPGPTFRSTPVVVGVVLTSLCFVATGSQFLPGVLLAGLVVPTGMLTYVALVRRRAAGMPISWLSALGTLLISASLTFLCSLWLTVVTTMTAIAKDSGMVGLPLFALAGLTIWLVVLIASRRAADVAEPGAVRPDWRGLVRVRLTVRGMLVGVAVVAFALWPVHLWKMRPTYAAIASYDRLVAGLREAESELMADRAAKCRVRAFAGAAWDLDDEASEDLKVCPYVKEGSGHSWREQAEIWERAAGRSWLAAQRRWERAAWYDPWFGPGEAR